MTLFEALPTDIDTALYHYCKDDECLNDAMLRALRNELKIDQVEHDKYSHDCFRCDKFKECKNEVESRVNKLEQENAELKMGLKWDADNRDELLKENAGLKARLNAINLLTPELEKASKEERQQLAKAKEIICEYVRLANLEKEDTVAIRQLYHKAEQFLSEVKE